MDQASWKYTPDLTEKFFTDLCEIGDELRASALDLMSVMMSESGVRATAHNPNGHASGLIQFMPSTLRGLGYKLGPEAFRKLTAEQQLPYVRLYFMPHRGRLSSIGAVYVATFLPALLAHAGDKDFVLTAKNGPLGWAYAPNAVFDANRDYAITVAELEDAVRRNCRGRRWDELVARLTRGPFTGPGWDEPDPADLRTTLGIQAALRSLGFDPGPQDGIPGPKTIAAVKAFQEATGLKVDGIVGPVTIQVLDNAMKSATR